MRGRLLLLLVSLTLLHCSSEPAPPDAALDGSPSDLAPAPERRADRVAPDLVPRNPVDLRADVNRNGTVDLDDPTEDEGEESWDEKHGAIFLANIDDDKNTCPKTGTDSQLAACHDAADEVVNGPDDLLDLARLKTVPWPKAPDDAVGSLALSARAGNRVRLFKKQGSDFVVFKPGTDSLSAAELRAGVELAIEGKDVVRDASVWEGFVDVTLSVKSAQLPDLKGDTVRLRLAPLITQHHLSAPLWVMATGYVGDKDYEAMADDLASAVKAAGIAKPLVEIPLYDQWTQDLFESAYMSMPAVGGPHVVYVFIRSANVENPKSTTNPLRSGGKIVFTALRGKDIGAIQEFDVNHEQEMDSLNSFGNHETVPPYSLAGKSYPLGRHFRGRTSTFYPDPKMTRLLESQAVQPPIYIDTSWLLVGHVDETISFVKAATPRGWAVLVNDPALAKSMLEKEVAAGNGGVKMFTGKYWLGSNNQEVAAEATISEVLADSNVMAESAASVVEIDKQLAVLKKETGLTDAEILRVPFLHWKVAGFAVAYQVGTVNGISLGDAHYGAPEPHGPVIGGKDIFKVQLEAELAKVGITVHWIEDWNNYHRLDGEVHCGSNTTRVTPTSGHWWESGL